MSFRGISPNFTPIQLDQLKPGQLCLAQMHHRQPAPAIYYSPGDQMTSGIAFLGEEWLATPIQVRNFTVLRFNGDWRLRLSGLSAVRMLRTPGNSEPGELVVTESQVLLAVLAEGGFGFRSHACLDVTTGEIVPDDAMPCFSSGFAVEIKGNTDDSWEVLPVPSSTATPASS